MSEARERMLSLGNSGNLIPEGKQVTFTINNPLADKHDFDETTPTLADVTRVLSTLLRDLETAGIIKTV